MIEFVNVSKNFCNDHSALLNISFKLNKEIFVVYGDEDSGKTTLLEIVSGLDTEYNGEIYIDGIERRLIDNKNCPISYVPTEPIFFSNKTVYENLKYLMKNILNVNDKKEISQTIIDCLKLFSLEGVIDTKVKKLNKLDKIMLSLARALLKKSKILLLDEPLKNLNSLEKTHLINSLNFVTKKLSSDTIVADNGQNIAYFNGCKKIKIEFGTKIC